MAVPANTQPVRHATATRDTYKRGGLTIFSVPLACTFNPPVMETASPGTKSL
jgi:hypothetical protein